MDGLDAWYGYRRQYPMLQALPPLGSLERFPDKLVLAARRGWTEAAFNEATTLLALEALAKALVSADFPPRFVRQAREFCVEEALHVELCVRVAEAFGGVVERSSVVPDWLVEPRDDDSLMDALSLAVRICCVGEAFSLPMLVAVRDVASTALVSEVLGQIVRDEARHGSFGFEVLDWAADRLTAETRSSLARTASETLRGFSFLWNALRSEENDGWTSEGYRVDDVHAVGFLESSAYRREAMRSIRAEVVDPLGARGVLLEWDAGPMVRRPP